MPDHNTSLRLNRATLSWAMSVATAIVGCTPAPSPAPSTPPSAPVSVAPTRADVGAASAPELNLEPPIPVRPRDPIVVTLESAQIVPSFTNRAFGLAVTPGIAGFVVTYRITNASKSLQARSEAWPAAQLSDEYGNVYAVISDHHVGRPIQMPDRLLPGESLRDVMVFEVPLDQAQKFTLDVQDGFTVGAAQPRPGSVSITIPKEKIRRPKAAPVAPPEPAKKASEANIQERRQEERVAVAAKDQDRSLTPEEQREAERNAEILKNIKAWEAKRDAAIAKDIQAWETNPKAIARQRAVEYQRYKDEEKRRQDEQDEQEKRRQDEQKAARVLRLACQVEGAQNLKVALSLYREIVRDYPDTPQAEEARQRIATLSPNPPK